MNNNKKTLHFKSMFENNDLSIKHTNKIWNHHQIIEYHHREF